ncbi:hypothetical protein [Ferrimonas lipolytica]|uniref:Flagellar protein FliT n=1 Tax=Ferrimonas lipolytica TaxID=2724191 RepID=A0A6H1UE49_9GAMM|nr:hypothetical protein [Ferrimonas lipolytica]QIZ77361.1 hypothetical protein HER31_11010 [Ferrimonas lipolytica]
MTQVNAEQFAALDKQIEKLLSLLETNQDNASNQEELPFSQLQPLLDQRQSCLAALLVTPLGSDRQWLEQAVATTKQIAQRAVALKDKAKQQLGGYKKGRQQVNRYKQIEAGRG